MGWHGPGCLAFGGVLLFDSACRRLRHSLFRDANKALKPASARHHHGQQRAAASFRPAALAAAAAAAILPEYANVQPPTDVSELILSRNGN